MHKSCLVNSFQFIEKTVTKQADTIQQRTQINWTQFFSDVLEWIKSTIFFYFLVKCPKCTSFIVVDLHSFVTISAALWMLCSVCSHTTKHLKSKAIWLQLLHEVSSSVAMAVIMSSDKGHKIMFPESVKTSAVW